MAKTRGRKKRSISQLRSRRFRRMQWGGTKAAERKAAREAAKELKRVEKEVAREAKRVAKEAAKELKRRQKEAAKKAKKIAKEVAKVEKQRLKLLEKLTKVVDNDKKYLKELGAEKMTVAQLKSVIAGEKEGKKEEAKRQKVVTKIEKAAALNGSELGSLDGFELPRLKDILKEQNKLNRKLKQKLTRMKRATKKGGSRRSRRRRSRRFRA